MADFNVRSDAVNVEQIMEQIRARIREKRGVDYTEAQIRELADIKLQKFLDPHGIRSDLLEQFRKAEPPPDLPNYSFEEDTLYESHRGFVRFMRRLLLPIFKLFWNPNPMIQVLNLQSRINAMLAARDTARRGTEALYYELIHNLVLETTRLGIEVQNLTMRVESLSSRLEFNERRARALESVVVYKAPPEEVARVSASPAPAPVFSETSRPAAPGIPEAGAPGGSAEGPGQRSRRRRRRRGRRGGGPAAAIMGAPGAAEQPASERDDPHSPSAESFQQALGAESESFSEVEEHGNAPAHHDDGGVPGAGGGSGEPQ